MRGGKLRNEGKSPERDRKQGGWQMRKLNGELRNWNVSANNWNSSADKLK